MLPKDLLKSLGIEAIDKTLYKLPKRDKGLSAPKTLVQAPNLVNQIDVLYLPNDKGYKPGLLGMPFGGGFLP